MKARTRFIKSVIKTASEAEATSLPWTRGAARSQTLMNRRSVSVQVARKSA